jgi:putative SOS response-associated peptidase YedK
LSRNISTAPPTNPTGAYGTTSPRPSRYQSFARIRRSPSANCRWSAGDSFRHGRKTRLSPPRWLARSETASTKPAFRDALKSRRCLIPADGFYEWAKTGKAKQPYCFEVNDGELFAFAGLWDRWKSPDGNWIKTCSILTTTPNAVTSPVHDRMPVILDPDSYNLWLDPGMRDVGAASELLKPCDGRLMRCYPISTRINHVANDDEECSQPVESMPAQNQLFS